MEIRKLSLCIILYIKYTYHGNKEAFPLHHILRYLKELCDDYQIKPAFTHTVGLKMELLKKFENELDSVLQQHLLLFILQL